MSASTQPSISIVVPVYTGKDYFAELLTLLQRQTLKNIEIIFVDDCGTDDTYSLAEKAAVTDSRIVLLRNDENRGPGFCRNVGIAAATGEYIAFVDADDIIPLDYYERLYQKAKATGALVVKCGRANLYPAGKIEVSGHNETIKTRLSKGEHLINSFGWEHTTAIYQREHIIKNKARNSDALQDEDTTFILGATYNITSSQFALVEDLFYYYRVNPLSLTRNLDATYLTESIKSFSDKLAYISNLPHSNAINQYVTTLVNNRIKWRYSNVLHEPNITKQQRKEYLVDIVNITRNFQKQYKDIKLRGISSQLINGSLTVSDYMDMVTQTSFTSETHANSTDDRKLALIVHEKYLKTRFWWYRLLASISFGKIKQQYKMKRNTLKYRLREVKRLKQNLKQSIKA